MKTKTVKIVKDRWSDELALEISQNGMKVKDICDKYSIGHTTLNNYLRRFNIPRHT